jgi:hypothetical protein
LSPSRITSPAYAADPTATAPNQPRGRVGIVTADDASPHADVYARTVVIPSSLGLFLALLPLAALVGPLVWMATRPFPDGG